MVPGSPALRGEVALHGSGGQAPAHGTRRGVHTPGRRAHDLCRSEDGALSWGCRHSHRRQGRGMVIGQLRFLAAAPALATWIVTLENVEVFTFVLVWAVTARPT